MSRRLGEEGFCVKQLECAWEKDIMRPVRNIRNLKIFRLVWDVLDAQNYLLPQRRNRVWGLAFVLGGHEDVADVKQYFHDNLKSLRSNFKFPSDKIFLNLPKEKPRNAHIDAIERGKVSKPYSQNLFVDCASSKKWNVVGDEGLPCVTPSHKIWSTQLCRYLTKEDLLNCQGLFKSCFNVHAYNAILAMDAQDLAGNAFASTVCQAVVMVSLAGVPGSWASVGRPDPDQHQEGSGGCGAVLLRRLKRKQPAPEFGDPKPVEDDKDDKERVKPPQKRRYKRKNPGTDARKMSKGKRPSASIWQKEQVMKAYEKAKSEGVLDPCKHVENQRLPGYFRCCVYRWSRPRARDHWSLICNTSPEMAKKCKEVPNVLRDIVGLPKKFSNRRPKSSEDPNVTTILPGELIRSAAMRQIPGKDEKVTQWAIEDDSKVKQPLPSWIALPIERKVTEWAAENSKWESKVEDRAAIGKPLAPTAQKRYDEFVKDKSECKLLFSKKGQKQVVKLRSNADWRKLQDDLFTIQIQMSSDPEQLRIKAADGSSQRLLLWQGEPTKKDMLPMFLANAGVSAAVAEAALQDFHEHEEKGEDVAKL
eukprot:Skav224451  [mRNA]  locus=scaffold3438:3800:13300:+ [translate_table: standard]